MNDNENENVLQILAGRSFKRGLKQRNKRKEMRI